MWIITLLFSAMTFLIFWMLFGYFIVFWFVGLFRRGKNLELPTSWPLVSVVVPCYNERGQILAKLENIRAIDYPRDRLEVVFADGGSTDETAELLAKKIDADDPFEVIRCPRRGKISQMNHVLPGLRGDIIVNTDADARIAADALKWIAAEFAADPTVMVVGAYCRPSEAIEIEQHYWAAQNKGRFIESDARTTSIVTAPCYAFRRELLRTFPDDVVADDIYVAMLANTLGFRTVYSRRATAFETRTPMSFQQFLPHKFRKSNAFLRESLRFLYRLPEMDAFCKILFITRIAQQLLLPWALLWWGLLASAMITLFRFDLVFINAFFLLIALVTTSRVFAVINLPGGLRRQSLFTVLNGYILTNIILLTTALSYPFFRQGSSYPRLREDTGLNKIEQTDQPPLPFAMDERTVKAPLPLREG